MEIKGSKAMGRDINTPQALLYYSKRAEQVFGSMVGSVPDDRGGRKEVVYTYKTFEPDASSYHQTDKCFVWRGPETDLQFVSMRSPQKPHGSPTLKM